MSNSAISLSNFLQSLSYDGQVVVGPPGEFGESELADAALTLRALDELYRQELPPALPAFNLAAALWAARLLCRACQFAVFRDVSAEQVAAELSQPCPSDPTAATHYSVDLVFRFLPDLTRFAQAASEQDRLVACLLEWAADWPLSSVGVKEASPRDLAPILGNRALLRLYVDRILAADDLTRLDDPQVAAAAVASWGLHEDLAPKAAQRCNAKKQPNAAPDAAEL